jgi:hypothetical protein
MVEPLRHRQTKGAETDMPGLPQPRHIPTLRIFLLAANPGEGRFAQPTAAAQAWRRELVLMVEILWASG